MRKPGIYLAALAMVISALVAPTTASAASNNCNHEQGGVGAPRSAKALTGGIGSIQLCIDSGERVWAYVVLYQPLPAGRWGTAWLWRYRNGTVDAQFSCDGEPGGNGHLKPGQTRCWTPKVAGSNDDYEFVALAWTYIGPHPDRSQAYANASTLICSATRGTCRV